ncbi:MAG TPA: D-alanine--D-alanine ligase [Tepidisphaeraceae bacterium]|jgi:D-alanine-D-alanine ligase
MRITVLCGGPSVEREVSLRSGKEVADHLRKAGHEVLVSDVSPRDLSGLDHPADVVFPVLHGDFGESGELQEILERRGLAFVGSGSAASRLGMDKIATKSAWRKAGLPTPAWRVLDEPPAKPDEFGFPVVIKANRSGSSIDVYICQNAEEVQQHASELTHRDGEALMEQFIDGVELTIGLLDGVALPPIRIATKNGVYDYAAKYTQGGSTHEFDLRLPENIVERCKALAIEANKIIGCRDMARVDLLLNASNEPFLLEINTIPGFTSLSLLPDAARQAGISFEQLVDRLAHLALARASAPVAS